ncbi:MAG: 6,7-dimethyl-8-ribityllumazine synthase [Planctomycetes bacterium]|nr:6,7-dimethyl-8-ribityllumazine synthase [Planctomycetota bacterium]
MTTTIARGSLDGHDLKIGVVCSRFNEPVTERLLEGALAGLAELGVDEDHTVVCSVPGAIEIPLAAQALCVRDDVDAVVALGAVVRGETSHYDYVCSMAADGCLRASLDSGKPVAFGVLTCDNDTQAFARCEPGENNKGREAAHVAVELANLLRGNEA